MRKTIDIEDSKVQTIKKMAKEVKRNFKNFIEYIIEKEASDYEKKEKEANKKSK